MTEPKEGKMPREWWHTVSMAQAALIPDIKFSSAAVDWRAVDRGFSTSALEQFSSYSGIPMKELQAVVIPLRTLKHRRQRKEPLNFDESDRLARIARIFELAVRIYGTAADAIDWLTSPKRRFDEKTPLSMLRGGAGELAVQEFLIQIDEGYFA